MGLWNLLFGSSPPLRILLIQDEDFCVYRSERSIEAWSTFRVPFEPTKAGELRLRQALREALDSEVMSPAGQELFRHAIYCSPVADSSDVENQACYNIGRWLNVDVNSKFFRLERQFKLADRPPNRLRADASIIGVISLHLSILVF